MACSWWSWRLDDRFRLLSKGPRDVLPRQRTLRSLLNRSYDLLTLGEQALLCRLSVFAGGWALEAAEAIGQELPATGGQPGDTTLGAGMARPDPGYEARLVLGLLEDLINKSLVLGSERTPGEPWHYRLLETVRHYAAERLAERGELAATRRAHAARFLALAEEAEPQLTGAAQGRGLARLEAEHDNLRAALAWLREHGTAEVGGGALALLAPSGPLRRRAVLAGRAGYRRSAAPRSRHRWRRSALYRCSSDRSQGWARRGRDYCRHSPGVTLRVAPHTPHRRRRSGRWHRHGSRRAGACSRPRWSVRSPAPSPADSRARRTPWSPSGQRRGRSSGRSRHCPDRLRRLGWSPCSGCRCRDSR